MKEYESKWLNLPRLFIAFILIIMVVRCATIQFGEPEEQKIAHSIGYGAAYAMLSNNPIYIPEVEESLSLALSAVKDEEVKIAKVISSIIDWADKFIGYPEFQKYAPHGQKILETFEDLLILDLDIPENFDRAKAITAAFLEGSMEGLQAIP